MGVPSRSGDPLEHNWDRTPNEVRRGAQGASRVAPGKSGLHARGEGVEEPEQFQQAQR